MRPLAPPASGLLASLSRSKAGDAERADVDAPSGLECLDGDICSGRGGRKAAMLCLLCSGEQHQSAAACFNGGQ